MPWPGNIRQLKSVIRRAALNAGPVITPADIASPGPEAATVSLDARRHHACAPAFPLRP